MRKRDHDLPFKNIEVDLREIDLDLIHKLLKEENLFVSPGGKIEPAPVIPVSYRQSMESEEVKEHGEKLLSQGKVAALVVAGGQGSRLGISGPKGALPISPIKHKSLFCLHAQKISALEKRYSTVIPFFIMTSKVNDGATREFFEKNDYFGLSPDHVHFFVQGMLPSVSKEGKFILSRDGGLFMNPDGHGGVPGALKKSGGLDIMKAQDIEEVFYFQVDNPLVRICDPLFLGLHNMKGAQMSSKVIRKRDFEEKVGVVALIDGETTIVEYSDMKDEDRYATDDKGGILYWAGSIATHIIRRDFMETLTGGTTTLPYHKAIKRIPGLDNDGKPIEVDGIKFETFIFDALPMTKRSVTLEVKREEEFAPVKNKVGEDSVQSAMDMQINLYRSWLEEAGKHVAPGVKVEISPTFALDEADIMELSSEIPEMIKTDLYLE